MASKVLDKLSFDRLSSTEFEEFCFELLCLEGFVNVDWRKGTGKESSPADSGRDIECSRLLSELDDSVHIERWYVDCKHYRSGVPASEMNNLLAWASSGRPNVALVISSNHLSNSAKQHLREYQDNNHPAFRIKYWELPNLERLSKKHPLLLQKYNLPSSLSFLEYMHPAHLEYIKKVHINNMSTFFEAMDNLDGQRRENIAGWLYEPLIRPRKRSPRHKNERYGDLFLDPVGYDELKAKCHEIVAIGAISETVLASYMINYLLQLLFENGDMTVVSQKQQYHREVVEYARQNTDKFETEDFESIIAHWEHMSATMPDRVRKNHELYNYFCEHIIKKMLDESLI